MKKILIAAELQPLLMREDSFLARTDIAVFTADSNDDILRFHIEHNVDLIVTMFDHPGLRCEELLSIIKQGKELGKVSTMIVRQNTVAQKEGCARCAADVVMTMPLSPSQFSAKVQELLDVAPRRSYRIVFNLAVDGKFDNKPFLSRTENVSASGMLIRSREPLAQGDRVSCSFYLPEGSRISAGGEIVRIVRLSKTEGNLYGVKFEQISAEHKAELEAFIAKELKVRDSQTERPEHKLSA